jgi:hypothetical protein
MVSPAWSLSVAVALACATTVCLFRLFSLRLLSVYPALSYFFLLQVALTAASSITGLKSDEYESIYLGLLIPEWIIYGLMLREIYAAIFSDYPGIAVLGRWSVYGALFGTALVAIVSTTAGRTVSGLQGTLLPFVESAAHCFTFGFSLLILIILVVISRYPIHLQKNVFINAVLFGAVMFGEAGGLIAELFTKRQHTNWLNLAVTVNTAVCFWIWPFLLSREGQTRILRLHTRIDPRDEDRLLGQLSIISSILITAARK